MSKTMLQMAQEAAVNELKKAFATPSNPNPFEGQENSAVLKQYQGSMNMLRELMTPGKASGHSLPLSEAMFADDFKVLFPKVVQEVLARPKEGAYLGQTLLSRTVQVDGAKIIQFPTYSALRAFELADNQEPPDQDPAFSTNTTEIRTRRYGLKLTLDEEVIAESQWDMLALMVEEAGKVMKRLKEEKIFNEYEARAVTLFDNSSNSTLTSGVSANGTTKNGTFAYMDLIDMMAALVANDYNPTDILLHPLAWAIWAKDPFLRYQLLHRGSIGQTIGTPSIESSGVQPYVPFGLNVVVTPFQKIALGTNVNSLGTGNYTTITVLDRTSSILILQHSPMKIVTWDDPAHDLRMMKFGERYGLALLNGGRSAVTAKNVKIDINHAPVYNVGNVTVA